MLLVGPRQALGHIATRIAYGAIAVVDFLPLRSAVTARGHPARIDDGPAFLRLVPAALALTRNRGQVGRPPAPSPARCDRERRRENAAERIPLPLKTLYSPPAILRGVDSVR